MKMKEKNKMAGSEVGRGLNAAVRISFLLRGLRHLISSDPELKGAAAQVSETASDQLLDWHMCASR